MGPFWGNAVAELFTGTRAKLTWAGGVRTGKNATADKPPPGWGFRTVIRPLLAWAISLAFMVACTSVWFTNVVARDWPFQRTTEPGTKPVPLIVSVKSAPPGATAEGTRGCAMLAIGLV